MDFQMIIGCLMGVSTFLAVICAYFYLFKRKVEPSEQQSVKQSTEPEKQHAAKDTDQINDQHEDDPAESKENVDPVAYAEHIPSEIKKAKQRIITKEIEAKMSTGEKEKERQIQNQQLEAIFKLMQQQDDKFGIEEFSDMSEQMKYYV